jgi:hypothetical protein
VGVAVGQRPAGDQFLAPNRNRLAYSSKTRQLRCIQIAPCRSIEPSGLPSSWPWPVRIDHRAQFFCSDDLLTSLIAAFGVFAAGFFMRPVGSLIFGHIGAKVGQSMQFSQATMIFPPPSI